MGHLPCHFLQPTAVISRAVGRWMRPVLAALISTSPGGQPEVGGNGIGRTFALRCACMQCMEWISSGSVYSHLLTPSLPSLHTCLACSHPVCMFPFSLLVASNHWVHHNCVLGTGSLRAKMLRTRVWQSPCLDGKITSTGRTRCSV